jgi:hypothetical protein
MDLLEDIDLRREHDMRPYMDLSLIYI